MWTAGCCIFMTSSSLCECVVVISAAPLIAEVLAPARWGTSVSEGKVKLAAFVSAHVS